MTFIDTSALRPEVDGDPKVPMILRVTNAHLLLLLRREGIDVPDDATITVDLEVRSVEGGGVREIKPIEITPNSPVIVRWQRAVKSTGEPK
jgi:hypothetical protein